MRKALTFSIILWVFALVVPLFTHAQYYSYPYQMPSMNYSNHTFAPYTSVNTSPYVNVSAPQYAYAHSSYSYPNYSYSYPSYSYSYPSYSYSYPSYTYPTYSYPSYSYGYNSYNSYNTYDNYCYSGYGCYPLPVDDPHQWIYDRWTGTWY